MLSEFISKQLKRATYEKLDDGTYFGEIPGLRGVWGNAKSLEACRHELQAALEDWLLFKVRDGDAIPGLRIPARQGRAVQHA